MEKRVGKSREKGRSGEISEGRTKVSFTGGLGCKGKLFQQRGDMMSLVEYRRYFFLAIMIGMIGIWHSNVSKNVLFFGFFCRNLVM